MVHLPHELWRNVFIDATTIPGFLETEPRSLLGPLGERETISFPFFDESDLMSVDDFFANAARNSMKTKLSIIQVSRSWKIIAEYLLYELVIITTLPQLEGFTKAIQKSWGIGDKCFGWFLKQVVIDLPCLDYESGKHFIADILKHCPRLEMFCNDYKCPGRFSPQFSNPRLRLLECLRAPIDIATLGENLEVLRASFRTTNATPLSLPRLHTLCFEDAPCQYISSMQHWILPALRHISFCCSPTDDCLPFFVAHGSQIRVLELNGHLHIPEVMSMCSSVEELIIPPYAPTSPFPIMEKLERLGITRTYFLDEWDEDYEGLFTELVTLFDEFLSSERFPVLKLVRLLDFGGIFNLDYWTQNDIDTWQDHLTSWWRAGIRLETRAGKIADFPSDVEWLVM